MAEGQVENIVKQGYLRRHNSSSNRLSGLFKRQEGNKWFVLTVRQGSPYLEQYDADVHVFSRAPLHSYYLGHCTAVRSKGSTDPPTFCVVCPDKIIELVAATRTQMLDWVSTTESCLVDLGIIKKETAEHVYSVCPAVVRKPKVSKEVLEERESEVLMRAANRETPSTSAATPAASDIGEQEEHRGNHTVDRRSLRENEYTTSLVEGASAMNPKPRAAVRSLTLKESNSNHSASNGSSPPVRPRQSVKQALASNADTDVLPPPLPNRHVPAKSGTASPSPAYASTETLKTPVQQNTESSTDSDFVPPEVIAQLSKKRTEDLNPFTQSSDILMNPPYVTRNKSDAATGVSEIKMSDQDISIKSIPALQIQPDSSKLDLDEDEIFSHHIKTPSSSISSVSLCSDSEQPLEFDFGKPATDIQENEYSLLPFHSGASALPTGDLNASYAQVPSMAFKSADALEDHLMKPIPLPRHVLTKQECLEDNALQQPFDEDMISGSSGEYKSEVEGATTLNGPERDSCDHQDFKDDKQKSLRDENENCYGLICDVSASASCLLPSSFIPPLPPRYDSLPESPKSHKKIEAGSNQFHPASDIISQSQDQNAPPLPLPRRNYLSVKSHSVGYANAFNDSYDLEIPPMPPRRKGPLCSQSTNHNKEEADFDTPPALPSRTAQSFFIKRPQLTNHASSDITKQQTSAVPTAVESDNGYEAGANGPSGLSRKMLLDRAHSLHTVVSLKQTQAEILQSEISMPSLTLTLTQKSGHGLALVDWNGLPCIVGWNQRDFPSLHGKLHIGDQLISVNGVKVSSVDIAQKLLRGATSPKITVMLHRMPFAKVFAIRRDAEGQSLGIKREGGTGEIVYVDPNGLAAQHGLSPYATGVVSELRCNWFITEINNRPVSLFYKENEIEHRLCAVGREISIVVQPSDFIHEIRRQFKKFKNYKSFIAQ
ncbi:syntenin-2 [Plakobranchus ocellatus]|uniref:Syntenin-2 n=1 Tax=Plakobranchus ocellatus TaxID=259542 RepID=A0AAV4E258_9GAST|nr:syntenin-2 [Plakobranchus ocellatus]